MSAFYFSNFGLAFLIITIWSTLWKGIALWRAARNSHQRWFVALLILQTAGILDMAYIFFWSEKKGKHVR